MKYVLRVSLSNKLRAQIIPPHLMSISLQMAHFGLTVLFSETYILAWNLKFQISRTTKKDYITLALNSTVFFILLKLSACTTK